MIINVNMLLRSLISSHDLKLIVSFYINLLFMTHIFEVALKLQLIRTNFTTRYQKRKWMLRSQLLTNDNLALLSSCFPGRVYCLLNNLLELLSECTQYFLLNIKMFFSILNFCYKLLLAILAILNWTNLSKTAFGDKISKVKP